MDGSCNFLAADATVVRFDFGTFPARWEKNNLAHHCTRAGTRFASMRASLKNTRLHAAKTLCVPKHKQLIIYIYICIFPPRDVPICLVYLYHRRVSAQLHLHRRCRLACCLVLLAKYPCLTHSPQFGSQTALATITSVIASLELVPFL